MSSQFACVMTFDSFKQFISSFKTCVRNHLLNLTDVAKTDFLYTCYKTNCAGFFFHDKKIGNTFQNLYTIKQRASISQNICVFSDYFQGEKLPSLSHHDIYNRNIRYEFCSLLRVVQLSIIASKINDIISNHTISLYLI